MAVPMTEKQREYIKSLAYVCGYEDNWEHAVADATKRSVYDVLTNGITAKDASQAINVLKLRSTSSGSEDGDVVLRG